MVDNQKTLKEKLNLTVWLARLRLAGWFAGGAVLGAGVLWLAVNFLPVLLSDESSRATLTPPPPPIADMRADLYQDFEQRFAKLRAGNEEELARLTQEMRAQMRRELESLSRRVNVLERDLASRPLPGAIASVGELLALKKGLAGRLDGLERRVGSPSGSEFALLGLALAALKRAALSGRKFETERIALKALLPNAKILDEMRSVSRAGVVPRAVLARDFTELAHRARARGGEEGSVWDVLRRFVFRIIRVRRVGEMKGDSAVAILSRIEAGVEARDFSAVLFEARGLAQSSHPRAGLMLEVLRPWLSDVRAREALDRGLLRLDIRVHEALSEVIDQENQAGEITPKKTPKKTSPKKTPPKKTPKRIRDKNRPEEKRVAR